jgi:hypothetical protein
MPFARARCSRGDSPLICLLALITTGVYVMKMAPLCPNPRSVLSATLSSCLARVRQTSPIAKTLSDTDRSLFKKP